MFVPLLLTLHLATPQLRPPTLERAALDVPELAAVALPRLLLQQVPPTDPYLGSARGAEIGGGVLGALGSEVALILVGAGIAATGTPDSDGLSGPGLFGAALLLMGQLGLVPLGAAVGANALSTDPLAGGFKGAAAYAYATEGIGLVGCLALTLVTALAGGGNAAAVVFLISYGALQLIGVPVAAAYGLHAGPAPSAAPSQNASPPAPLPNQPPPQDQPPPSYTPPPGPPPPTPIGFALPF